MWLQVPAAQEPGEAGVGDVGAGEYQGLQTGTVDADNARHVVIALLGQSQHTEVVEVLESVGQQVGRDGAAVRLLQVELLQVTALVQAADGGHQHSVIVPAKLHCQQDYWTSLLSPLSSESLDVFGEEESDVLHKLFVIVTRNLQGGEDFVQEGLIQVDRDQTEEMSVQQWQHNVPQSVLDLGRVQHVGRLSRVEVVETCGDVYCGSPQTEAGQAQRLQLRCRGREITFEDA